MAPRWELILLDVGYATALGTLGISSSILAILIFRLVELRAAQLFDKMVAVTSAFAGGVFLGAGFIHLLPDSADDFPDNDGYPFSYLTSAATILAMILLEKLLIPVAIMSLFSLGRRGNLEHLLFSPDGCERRNLLKDAEANRVDSSGVRPAPGLTTTGAEATVPSPPPEGSTPPGPHEYHLYSNSMLALVLAGALCGHSLFEGIPIGLADDIEFSMVPFVAVMIHKGFAIMALAVELLQTRLRRWVTVFLLLAVSLMSPFGVIVGSIIAQSNVDGIRSSAVAVFDSVAAGTFLYMGMMELGHHMEVSPETHTFGLIFLQWSLALLGLTIMALVAIWV